MKRSLIAFISLIGAFLSIFAEANDKAITCVSISSAQTKAVSLCFAKNPNGANSRDYVWTQRAGEVTRHYFVVKKASTSSCGPSYDDNYCFDFKLSVQEAYSNSFGKHSSLISGNIKSTDSWVLVSAKSDLLTPEPLIGDVEIDARQAHEFSSFLFNAVQKNQ